MIEESSSLNHSELSELQANKTINSQHNFMQNNQNQYHTNDSSVIKIFAAVQCSSKNEEKLNSCLNKICPKLKNSITRVNQAKSSGFDPSLLCDQCFGQYKKQAYCLYCKQIYFDSSDDGKQWIECEGCSKWVHSECANYDHSLDSEFKCIKCKKSQISENQPILIKKQSSKPNNKQTDRRKQLVECSLNAYGFYWQLAPKQLAEDMDKIREYLN